MDENRRQILEMLADGKVTTEEAERLIAALGPNTGTEAEGFPPGIAAGSIDKGAPSKSKARFLRVLVEANEKDKTAPVIVNVRVPMKLLYAGVRLASLIPAQAHEHLDQALNRHGVPLTLSQIKPENLEELIDHLEDLTVDVDAKEDNTKVRVFCE